MSRIELTEEIKKAITTCCPVPLDCDQDCFKHCALAGACLEYYTGDNSCNED